MLSLHQSCHKDQNGHDITLEIDGFQGCCYSKKAEEHSKMHVTSGTTKPPTGIKDGMNNYCGSEKSESKGYTEDISMFTANKESIKMHAQLGNSHCQNGNKRSHYKQRDARNKNDDTNVNNYDKNINKIINNNKNNNGINYNNNNNFSNIDDNKNNNNDNLNSNFSNNNSNDNSYAMNNTKIIKPRDNYLQNVNETVSSYNNKTFVIHHKYLNNIVMTTTTDKKKLVNNNQDKIRDIINDLESNRTQNNNYNNNNKYYNYNHNYNNNNYYYNNNYYIDKFPSISYNNTTALKNNATISNTTITINNTTTPTTINNTTTLTTINNTTTITKTTTSNITTVNNKNSSNNYDSVCDGNGYDDSFRRAETTNSNSRLFTIDVILKPEKKKSSSFLSTKSPLEHAIQSHRFSNDNSQTSSRSQDQLLKEKKKKEEEEKEEEEEEEEEKKEDEEEEEEEEEKGKKKEDDEDAEVDIDGIFSPNFTYATNKGCDHEEQMARHNKHLEHSQKTPLQLFLPFHNNNSQSAILSAAMLYRYITSVKKSFGQSDPRTLFRWPLLFTGNNAYVASKTVCLNVWSLKFSCDPFPS